VAFHGLDTFLEHGHQAAVRRADGQRSAQAVRGWESRFLRQHLLDDLERVEEIARKQVDPLLVLLQQAAIGRRNGNTATIGQ
jgi:hypothetical protein